ncbi:hypothetical protein H0H87_001821 [Tephrocybe sp. NHM501043]|nr:hypothetical protein H0H87_001821 [Tephrocybe sp. NHM501043]
MSVPVSLPPSATTNIVLSSSPDSLRDPTNPISSSPIRRRASDASDLTTRLRHSPTLSRSFDPEARERQRTMDVDMAMHLSRARRETGVVGSPEISPVLEHAHHEEEEEHVHLGQSAMHTDAEEEPVGRSPNTSRIDLNMLMNQTHDPSLLAHAAPLRNNNPISESLFELPTYQANITRSDFDFSPMEEFASIEKATLGLAPATKFTLDTVHFPSPPPRPAEQGEGEAGPSTLPGQLSPPLAQSPETDGEASPRASISTARQRKLSHSAPQPRSHRKGIKDKMALFETPHDPFSSALPSVGPSITSRLSIGLGRHPTVTSTYDGGGQPPLGGILHTGHDRPYRFSFYSNALAATIHARSLSELPAENQTFEQLFAGANTEGSGANGTNEPPPSFRDGYFSNGSNGVSANPNRRPIPIDQKLAMGPGPGGGNGSAGDSDDRTWWLDVTSPTDEEMKMLSKSIEYEVDSIDELVLILKDAEQSDMLRRIGTCRKKVMGLLRLMGNKADVVKGLAKRCNENWRVAPTSDIGLYLSDIQDHLITMTQNLNHYEKILSRSHSNYLAQISIEMTDANNQINDVLSKLTALGTVLIPMNLITGLWGMNVHVPGEDVEGYAWFISIVAGLAAFALIGGYSTYRFMVGRS